jgi:cell division protease FtsH
MSENQESKKPFLSKPSPSGRGNYQIWLLVSLVLLIVGLTYFNKTNTVGEITEQRFQRMLAEGDVKEIIIVKGANENHFVEVFLKPETLSKYQKDFGQQNPFAVRQGPQYKFDISDVKEFKENLKTWQKEIPETDRVAYRIDNNRTDFTSWFFSWGFFILLLFGFYLLMRRMAGMGPGGQIFNIGKSKAALFDADNKVKITFADVAGLDEAKEEVQEVVDFLKNPSKYTNLGGKIPKGVLLVGPPGTGKTLLAKAVAGEAGVPFFSLSGSDFVEMFVGVGAARVRDLFRQAREKAPCIIFIDEIDAIGRSRGRGAMPGSNDERENTLNSLLVEMDGFGTDSGVIIMAATNRPDVLDSALLRPGRFDREISVDVPDIAGREAILKVHLQPLKLAADVDVKKIAAQTPGFAGAELANLCNEAALIAARRNKPAVELQDFQDAIDRVIGGLEKKNKIISPEEKNIVAYHEAGHAIAGWFLEHANPLVKVSIVPRGVAALGYALYLPKEQFLRTAEQLIDEICVSLGGRVAEDIIFGKISTGALSDLEHVTKIAYSMITVYGMNDKIGNISFYDSKRSEYAFDKPYSEATAELIDKEVKILIESAYQRTKNLLVEKRRELEILAQELLKKEVIFQHDLELLIGKRPFNQPTAYEEYVKNSQTPNATSESK